MKKTRRIDELPTLPENLPVHVYCRCVTAPMAPTIQLPGEDVLTQAERVVAEYEAGQMNKELQDRLLATLAQKTGRRWQAKALPGAIEAKMFVEIDGKTAWVSYPVSESLLEDAFDVAVEKIIEGAADEIGRLIVGLMK